MAVSIKEGERIFENKIFEVTKSIVNGLYFVWYTNPKTKIINSVGANLSTEEEIQEAIENY